MTQGGAWRRPRPAELGVLLVFALLAWRFLQLIDGYAVDILYWDQWDLYEAFTRESGAWELFRWQHGPHRQGVGFLLTRAVAELSGWNARAEAFLVGALIVAAAAAALSLRRRLFGDLTLADVAIPLVFLTPTQYGVFVDSPNASHGAAPLLLLMLYSLAWTLPDLAARVAAVAVLNFGLVHTGFGLFAAALTPVLLACELAVQARVGGRGSVWLCAAACVAALASVGIFFVGWTFEPAVRGFTFPSPEAASYPRYAALMFAKPLGVAGTGIAATLTGFAVLTALIACLIVQVPRLASADPTRRGRATVIVALIGFSLLFCASTAVGRISLGLSSARAGRYVPLVVPAVLGLLMALRSLGPPRLRGAVLAAAAIAALAASVPVREADRSRMQAVSGEKRAWVESYLETRSVEAADRHAGMRVYPWPAGHARLAQKLAYQERWGLGPFRDRLATR